MPAPLVFVGIALVAAALGFGAYEYEHHKSPSLSAGPQGLLPAFPRIVSATPAQRQAILRAAAAIPANPIALATVIQSESGWDPAAPKVASGTPRAGLNQITQGAHMPGLSTAAEVWAVRSWPLEKQLTDVVVPYLQRFAHNKHWNGGATAMDIYKLNFLPALAGEGDDVHLGEKDSTETIAGGLTKGQIYASNPGFDHGQKGYFTWADVAQTIASVEKQAHGKLVDVAGALHDWPGGGATPPAPANPPAPQPSAPEPAPAPESPPAPGDNGGDNGTDEGVAVGEPSPGDDGGGGPRARAPAALAALGAPARQPIAAQAPTRRRAIAPTLGAAPAAAPAAAILALRDAVDRAWPNRGRWNDGILGDSTSRARRTDHTIGNAIDITMDPVNGPPMAALLDAIWDKDGRVSVQIWNNKFRSRSVAGGTWQPYCDQSSASCSPHTRHAHIAVRADRRDDGSPWDVGVSVPTARAAEKKTEDEGLPLSPSDFADTDPVGHYLLDAWNAGLVDNVSWVPIRVGPFDLEVAAEPLAVHGVRVPASMNDAIAIARSIGAILPTREIVDAIWSSASRQVAGPLFVYPDSTWGSARGYNSALGPTGNDLAAGGWQNWILAAPMGIKGAVEYGLRDTAGGADPPSRGRGPDYLDQIHLVQLVRRAATAGDEDVDLLEWLARSHRPDEVPGGTGQELGGPIGSVLDRFKT